MILFGNSSSGIRREHNMSRAARLGAFIVGALAILVSGIFIIGGKQYLFTSTYRLNTQFASVVGWIRGRKFAWAACTADPFAAWSCRTSRPIRSPCGWTSTDRLTTSSSKIRSPPSKPRGSWAMSMWRSRLDPAKGANVADGGTIGSEPPLEMADLLKKADGILDSSQEALKNVTHATANLSSISAKIDDGQGTVGALINDKNNIHPPRPDHDRIA